MFQLAFLFGINEGTEKNERVYSSLGKLSARIDSTHIQSNELISRRFVSVHPFDMGVAAV